MNSKLLVFLLLIVVLALAGYICLQHFASMPPEARSSSPDTPVALTPKTVVGPSSESAQPPPVLFKEATKAAPAPHAPVVAVTEFVVASDDAQLLKMSQEIRQVLEQKLGDQGLTLVDRSKLQDALRGAKLTMAGIADSDSAKQLGKVLNADYIVTSRLSELAGTLIVTCKAIDTETSQIISVGADAKKDQIVEVLGKTSETLANKLKAARSAATASSKEVKLPAGARPKVMLLFNEVHLTRHVPDPASETAFARFFLNNGFGMIDAAVSAAIQSDEKQMAGLKTDLQALARIGLEKQADVIVLGEAFSELGATVEGFVTCRARVEVKAVNTRTAALIVYDSAQAGAADIAEHVAGKSAIESAANQLAPRIASAIIERWQGAAGNK